MAKNKTTETTLSVTDYIDAIEDEQRRKDCVEITNLFKKATKLSPKMWGPAIVGFGAYHYKYDSGHEGDAPLVAFSSRANAISLYLSSTFKEREELLQQLGKYKTGKGCIYIKKLSDIDTAVLTKMIKLAFDHSKLTHAC